MQKRLSPFIDTRLEIRWIDEIGGRGVFAREDIPTGVLLERAPLIIMPKSLIHIGMWFLQAEGMPDTEFVLDQYSLEWGPDSIALPLGWAGIYNHSDANNARFCYWSEEDPSIIGVITQAEILAGSQITVSYGANWFKAKPYVTKVNF